MQLTLSGAETADDGARKLWQNADAVSSRLKDKIAEVLKSVAVARDECEKR